MMSIVEKVFLGSLMKEEYLLKDTVIQPEHLESVMHKELMRRMVELKQAGKNIDLVTLTTLPDLIRWNVLPFRAVIVCRCGEI
jgi:replicative DNA helicase